MPQREQRHSPINKKRTRGRLQKSSPLHALSTATTQLANVHNIIRTYDTRTLFFHQNCTAYTSRPTHHVTRSMSARSAEEVFEGAGSRPGLEAWRIEKTARGFIEPVANAEALSGLLHSGDAYIFLSTCFDGGGVPPHKLFIWEGAESHLERGAAAELAVELDTKILRGLSPPAREVQTKESASFIALLGGKARLLRLRESVRCEVTHTHTTYFLAEKLNVALAGTFLTLAAVARVYYWRPLGRLPPRGGGRCAC